MKRRSPTRLGSHRTDPGGTTTIHGISRNRSENRRSSRKSRCGEAGLLLASVSDVNRRIFYPVLMASLLSLTGCAGDLDEDDETAESADALQERVLRPSECEIRAPNRSRVEGVYDATLSGCLIARPNETGAQLVERAVALVVKPELVGSARRANGDRMFASFKAAPPTLAGRGMVAYDARVGIDILGPFDAKGTLRFDARRTPEGGLTLRVTNTTTVGALGINPLQPNGLEFVLTLVPARNGVIVRGSVQVQLVSHKSSVNGISALAPDIVVWLKGQLGAR